MSEAWQVRELEQQDLLEEIMGDARHFIEGGDHDAFFLALSAELTGSFIAERLAQQGPVPTYLNLKSGDQVIARLCNGFKEKIKKFSRTPEEEQELLARLLIEFVEAGLSGIHGAYLHQKVHEPKRLYDGHEAMDEIDIPDESFTWPPVR